MRILKTLIATVCLLSLAGAALAVDLHEASKVPVDKPGDPHIMGTQGLLNCSGAIEINLGTNPAVVTGTNVGAPNVVTYYGCSSWNESGGEVIYRVTFPADVTWAASLSGMTGDLDLAVLDMCDESLGCLIVVDSNVYVSAPYPGEFYFVVDGYAGASSAFTLTVTTTPFVTPPTICELIQEATGTFFMGDTCDGYNNIQTNACGTYSEAGLEHYYEIKVPAGCNFTANVTYDVEDGALWLLDTCATGYACIGYADDTLSGDMETLTYANATGTAQSVILVLDAWGTGACGTYQFEFISDCAVATERESFGGVKAMFR